MPTPKIVARTFKAVLEHSGDRLNWTIARVPLDVAKVWGVRGQLKVKGEINGFAFRTSLFPTGKGQHILMVNKKMQKGGGAKPGTEARFRLEPDTEKREIVTPQELLKVLKQSKALQKFHDSLSYSNRREIAKWVSEAKQAETRVRRAEQMAERMMLVLEGERDLPPVLRVAMARNLKARAGWDRMPPSQRRWHLFGIFGYRNPESQQRRVSKAVEHMVAYADKGRKASDPEDEMD